MLFLLLALPAHAATDCTALPTDAAQIDCLNDRVQHLISLMQVQSADLAAVQSAAADNAAAISDNAAAVAVNEGAIAANKDAAVANEAAIASVESRVEAIEGDHLIASDLTGYASEAYVDSAVGNVDLSAYLTASDLSGYATEDYVDSAVAALDLSPYLIGDDLSGYATEDWVESQGYTADTVDDALVDLASYLSVDTSDDSVVFTGANVYVQSGAGSTNASVNGLGNLIVGYDEDSGDTKTGSHNLVVGSYHSYSDHGGIVAGYDNDISGAWASVLSGEQNTASGDHSAVVAGYGNTASTETAVVVGGWKNTVGGGYDNVIVGGYGHLVSTGIYNVILGGENNEAAGGNAVVVVGGSGNTTSSDVDLLP